MSWRQGSNTVLFFFSVWIFTGCGGSASLSKNSPDLTIITTELPRGTAEQPYSFSLRAQGGVAPYRWELASGALPSRLVLDTSSGAITGTPLSAAESVVDIRVRDSAQTSSSQSFTLTVNASNSASSTNATYYLDSAAGSDGNDGTSAATPWRTISKVNSTGFTGGDHILFKRGSTWRELLALSSSGEAGNPIVMDAYGAGAAPIISGADLVPQNAWTLCSDCKSGVWRASMDTQPNIVLFNGVTGNKKTSISGLAVAGDWFWVADVLYVWCSMNPGSFYGNPGMEAGRRLVVVDLSALAFVTVQNLHLTGANGIPTNAVIYAHTQNGVPTHDVVLNNLEVTNGAGHGVHLEDCNNCTIQGVNVSTMASDGIRLVAMNTSYPISSASITGNTVIASRHDGIATYGCAIGGTCQGVTFPSGIFLSGISISGNVVHDNGEGIYLEWTNHSSVSANTVYHNSITLDSAAEGGGIELEASSYNTIQKNLVYSNRGNGIEMSNDAGAGITLTGASHNTIIQRHPRQRCSWAFYG